MHICRSGIQRLEEAVSVGVVAAAATAGDVHHLSLTQSSFI